jgi:hypothetical protein
MQIDFSDEQFTNTSSSIQVRLEPDSNDNDAIELPFSHWKFYESWDAGRQIELLLFVLVAIC